MGMPGPVKMEIPVDSITGVAVNYATVDLTAWQDPAHGFLPDVPIVKLVVAGPWDSAPLATMAASAAAPVLSGSHTALAALYNLAPPQNTGGINMAICICYGIRGYYTTGDPAFGITTGTAANGFWLSNYTVDMNAGKYSATFDLYPGSALPTWVNALPA